MPEVFFDFLVKIHNPVKSGFLQLVHLLLHADAAGSLPVK
jgi:hypothetical protein